MKVFLETILYSICIFLGLLAVAMAVEDFPTCECEFEKCHCVSFYLCINDRISTDGYGVLDWRTLPHRPLVPETRGQCDFWKICCPAPDTVQRIGPPVLPRSASCGRSNVKASIGRILNSDTNQDNMQYGEFPWMAAILRQEPSGINYFLCGATLIGQRTVITAAHCVLSNNETSLIVRLGEYDIKNIQELYPHQDYQVTDVVIHPQFKLKTAHNDIALLRLAENVKFTTIIDTICMPSPGESFLGKHCYVTGWGKNAFGKYENILKKVPVPSLTNEDCQVKLRKTRLGPYFKLHKGFMCAGGEKGKDACQGDGGGPLMCQKDGFYKLAGIVVWGIDCGKQNVPGVYIDVGYYLKWIIQVAKSLGETELAFV